MNNKALNPFGTERKTPEVHSSDERRAMEEIQAGMIIAKRFPRDQMAAMDRILKACTRPTLAENAVYAFRKGGTMVTGPSVRLAEAMAQTWGNITFGVRELSQKKGDSIVEAFAWDLETNTKQVKVFSVQHKRKARGKTTTLEDPRDVYEVVANQGARRMRACILGIIPGDVTEAAVRQCEITMQNTAGVPEEEIHKLIEAFNPLGVTSEMLRKRLGHDLEATISAEILQLRKIYASLRDGMSAPADWFEIPQKRAPSETVKAGDGLQDIEKAIDATEAKAPESKLSEDEIAAFQAEIAETEKKQ